MYLTCFSGLMFSLSLSLSLTHGAAADVNLVWPQVPAMIHLIQVVGADDERSDSLVASAAGLLG